MNNLEKYKEAFSLCFGVPIADVEGLKMKGIPAWDSVGHMGLIAQIEGAFEIQLDSDDIIDFISFEKGKEILSSKYGVQF